MVIAYSLYNIILQKYSLFTNKTNDRLTLQLLPYYFWGYWELPNNRVANANGLTRRNPGSGWRTDMH